MPSSKDSRPLVSLVTPTFNQATFLAEAIESVLAQVYPCIEYQVLDDGSTDNTPEILAGYKDQCWTDRHENRGQSACLNAGWARSSGEYIGYLSSDDKLYPDAMVQLVDALERNPNAVVAYGDFDLVDRQGSLLRRVKAEPFDRRRLTVDLVCQPGVGVLWRRNLFDTIGGWDAQLRQVPDFEYWLRASTQGSFVHVPQVLGAYRVHGASASYGAVSAQRSLEIHHIMRTFWGREHSPEQRQSMALTELVIAKSHAQAARPLAYLMACLRALRRQPQLTLSHRAWRLALSGPLNRVHRLWR